MRVALVSPPMPAASFINRDLFGGLGINDNFGTDGGSSFVAFLKAEGTVIPEIAFPYLAAILRDHTVRFFDGARLDAGQVPALVDQIAAFAPNWIFASSSYSNLRNETEFVADLKRRTNARTCLFGYCAHWFAEPILRQPGIDFVISGEVEAVAPQLLAASDPSTVPGLRFWENGALRDTGFQLVKQLDDLPFPDWSVTPLDRYFYFPLLKQRPFVTLLSSRGCTFGCSYCPYPIAEGTGFRARSPENIAAEMEHLVGRFGVRSILFRDPNFGLQRERVIKLCRLLVERGIRVDWGCETRLDGIDDEVASWLAKAGCRSVEIGMDGLSAEVARQNHRKIIPPQEVRRRLHLLHKHGLESAGLFLIGLPGDTPENIESTFRFVDGLDLTYVNYQIPVPFPGTAMYERAVQEGWIAPVRFEDLRGSNPPMSSHPALDTARLQALQSEGVRRFYVRARKVAQVLTGGEFLLSVRFLASSGSRFLRERARSPSRPS